MPDLTPSNKPPHSLWPTILVTAFLGVFGLIPAAVGAAGAETRGTKASRYWKAFGFTMIVNVVAYAAVVVIVIVAVGSSVHTEQNDALAADVQAGQCSNGSDGPDSFLNHEVSCSSPHKMEIVLVATPSTENGFGDPCNNYPATYGFSELALDKPLMTTWRFHGFPDHVCIASTSMDTVGSFVAGTASRD